MILHWLLKSDSCSGGPLQRGAPCHGIIGIMVNPPLIKALTMATLYAESIYATVGSPSVRLSRRSMWQLIYALISAGRSRAQTAASIMSLGSKMLGAEALGSIDCMHQHCTSVTSTATPRSSSGSPYAVPPIEHLLNVIIFCTHPHRHTTLRCNTLRDVDKKKPVRSHFHSAPRLHFSVMLKKCDIKSWWPIIWSRITGK